MATRDASRTGPLRRPRLPTVRRGLSQYDLVLIAIPLAFVFGAALATTLGHSLTAGLRTGGLLAGVMTGYALFGVSPEDELSRSGRPR